MYADDLQATVDRVGSELVSFGTEAVEGLAPEKAVGLVRYLTDMQSVLDAAATVVPLLRRRCPDQNHYYEGKHYGGGECRGWLPPDPPDWWEYENLALWEWFCERVWRVACLYTEEGK